MYDMGTYETCCVMGKMWWTVVNIFRYFNMNIQEMLKTWEDAS